MVFVSLEISCNVSMTVLFVPTNEHKFAKRSKAEENSQLVRPTARSFGSLFVLQVYFGYRNANLGGLHFQKLAS